jgi:hypothetical protein
MSDSTPRIFISHSSKDKDFVRRLTDDLQKANLSVWLDEREIHAGDSIPQGVSGGLQDTNILVVVLSQNSAQSAWVQRELDAALMGQLGGSPIRVIPVRLDDAPVPPLLNPILYADFRTDYQSGLSKLLNALQGSSPAPTPIAPARIVDRNKLIKLLEGLTDDLFNAVLGRIPHAGRQVLANAVVYTRTTKLIEFAESSVGPGLDAVADAVVDVFPHLAPEKLPFR